MDALKTQEPEPLEQDLIEFRHLLHMYPEPSRRETETSRRIREVLAAHGIRELDLPLATGVAAEIGSPGNGPVIALRADIDALPIEEKSGVAFASRNPGTMHACGHDVHTAVILGAALLLKREEERLRGSVRLIFQPAEETAEGARAVLGTGVLEGVKAIFGFHNDPSLPVGTLGSRHGVLTAGVERFAIRIRGKGAHAAKPHEGSDPIVAAAHLIQMLQTIVSRNVPSYESAVVSVTQIHSGNTWNVLPEEAFLEGTVRTFGKDIRHRVRSRMEEMTRSIGEAFGVEAKIDWLLGVPSVDNVPEWTDFAMDIASQEGYAVKTIPPTAVGEDFAFYLEQIPGAFVMIGSGGPYELHDPRFLADDRMILPASRYFARLAISALDKLAQDHPV